MAAKKLTCSPYNEFTAKTYWRQYKLLARIYKKFANAVLKDRVGFFAAKLAFKEHPKKVKGNRERPKRMWIRKIINFLQPIGRTRGRTE